MAASPFPVTTSNISMGGLMLHTAAAEGGQLQVGDDLLLALVNPEGGRMLKYKSCVTWIRHGLANLLGTWAFGVRFVETDENEIRILHDPAARAEEPLPE